MNTIWNIMKRKKGRIRRGNGQLRWSWDRRVKSICVGLLLVICQWLVSAWPVSDAFLIVNLNSESKAASPYIPTTADALLSASRNPLKNVKVCIDCDDPAMAGSYVVAIEAKFGVKNYDVTGELVYCVPNMAEGQILNGYQFPNRIVMVNRGQSSFWEKVSKIQSEGASGVIIADDGTCGDSDHFLNCGPRAGSVSEGGFAAHDDRTLWATINIPVVLVTAKNAQRLRSLMEAKLTHVVSMGQHYINEVNENKQELKIAAMSVNNNNNNNNNNYNNNKPRSSAYGSVAFFENKKEKRKLYGNNIFDTSTRKKNRPRPEL